MQPRNSFPRAVFFLFLLTCLLTGLVGIVRVPVSAAPNLVYPATSVVISEFRFRGDGAGNDEFIELYNPTGSAIDISGWLIRGSNNAGTTSTRATIPASTILQPDNYYLVAHTGYSGPTTADLTYGTGITDDGGVALTLADTTTIIDQVGLSAGSLYKEGATLASLAASLDQGYERRIGGANGSCQDDGNNAVDFTLITTSDPQNSASALVTCGIPTSTPVPAINVLVNEVAWSGTQAFSGDEWIELYNATGAPIDLTSWRLEAADGDPIISLSGYTIPATGYLLLERGSPNVTNVSTGGNVVAATYFSGLLNDSGETLYLINDLSQIVDTANSNGGGWPGGSGSVVPLRSMERIGVVADSDFVWVTYVGIPIVGDPQDAGSNFIYGTPGDINYSNGAVPTATATFTSTATATSTATFTPTNTSTSTITPSGTATNSPTPLGFLSLVINEVAWAGTGAASADEWIELYNPGSAPINLSGWTLKALDGTPSISLTGSIPAGGYFLLERTDNTTVSDIVADQIYTGEMSNSGETLQLFDPSNRVIDTANSNGGSWPAGSSATFGTMERRAVIADSDTAWITNTGVVSWGFDAGIPNTCTVTPPCTTAPKKLNGTPKHQNWAFSVTATPSPTRTATPRPTATRTPTLPPPPPLVAINEFIPRPGQDWNNDGSINIGDEYIELINHGVVPVNLGGYTLDDEANIGSTPYRLPSVTLQPGERIVFYGSETGLLLSDGGDGVRLLKPNGQLADAYNYNVVRFPDQSFCRLPDNGGLDDWNTNCSPTAGLPNKPGLTVLNPSTGDNESLCPISDVLPIDFVLAECPSFGNIWNRLIWDITGWFGELFLPNMDSQWEVYVD